MQIQDDDDKLRRNVIAISTAIILSWWLKTDLPVALQAAEWLSNVPARRFWLAALVITGYCLLRYHFSDQRALHSKRFVNDHRDRRNSLIGKEIRRSVANQRNKAIDEYARKNSKPVANRRRFSSSDIKLDTHYYQNWKSSWFQVRFSGDDPGEFEQRYGGDPENGETLELRTVNAIIIQAKSWLYTGVWSRGTFELTATYVIAAWAIGICISRLNQ